MPRGPRLDAPGTLHHVIIRGIERGQIVSDDKDRKNLITRMGNLVKETGTAIYAWALMTNHAHILLRSGKSGMPGFMRSLLTGYAVSYNRRHKRYGHVFQNRYKSIVCEEEPYFQRLVCYIHLNPLRAGLVNTIDKLDIYHWCGHGVLMKKQTLSWQDRDYVLGYFGRAEGSARKAYRNFIMEQSTKERQPELTGGGLIRSMGGWSAVRGKRRQAERKMGDERILGSGAFVQQMLNQAAKAVKYQIASTDSHQSSAEYIKAVCAKEGITEELLKSGSRRHPLPRNSGDTILN